MAATHSPVEMADAEVVGALDIIRRHARLKKTVQVFVEAGMTEATGYRRLNAPGDLKVDELAAIARRFGVPIHVIAEGEFATARWFKENPTGTPDPSGGQVIRPRGWNDRRRTSRETVHLALAA